MSAQLALLSGMVHREAPLCLNGHLTEVQLLFDVNTDLHARGGGKLQPLPAQNPCAEMGRQRATSDSGGLCCWVLQEKGSQEGVGAVSSRAACPRVTGKFSIPDHLGGSEDVQGGRGRAPGECQAA